MRVVDVTKSLSFQVQGSGITGGTMHGLLHNKFLFSHYKLQRQRVLFSVESLDIILYVWWVGLQTENYAQLINTTQFW